ncbi:MAG: phosphatidate cytidylyltransferase [Mycobacteriales bacterium]
MAAPDEVAGSGRAGRAGRDLPVALVVGLALGAVVTVPLYTDRVVFVGVVVVAVLLGVGEVARALKAHGSVVPVPPVAVGGAVMVVLAYQRGSAALAVALLLSVLVALAWLALDAHLGTTRRTDPARLVADAAATVFTLGYVPFLASFAALLTAPPDGARRVTAFVATVVCSDVGGYAAGVLAGRHPMAPSVSPKKSWEGLVGSAAACLVAGAVFFTLLFHVAAVRGLAYGAAVVATATLGDLGESMLKRDLGIKDMGNLLPGHGGIMDRLDSLLITAPVAWLLLSTLAPVHG